MRRKPADFDVLSGDDNLTFPLICLGATGVISVASNLVPRRMADLVSAALTGDVDGARDLHNRLFPLFKALFIETNPVPIKAAMALTGFLKASYRLPLCPMTAAHEAELRAVLEDQGIL
jgi:4-hydroxy-tetrahydrodipicolinate synthase